MIGINFTEVILLMATFLSGFYAGTGFFVALGGNPAIALMTNLTFAEYWQHTDHFMAKRMKIFCPSLLLSILLACICLWKTPNNNSFLCMLAAFFLLVTDVVFTLATNHPLNKQIQSWWLDQLPANVQDIKGQVIRAFNTRVIFMMGSFTMVLVAVWLQHTGKK